MVKGATKSGLGRKAISCLHFVNIDNLDNCFNIKSKFSIYPIRKQGDSINRIVYNINLMPKCKRSQANIIAIVLIILMVLVAMVIFWNIFNPFVKEKSKDINTDVLNTNIQIKEVSLYATGAYRVEIERISGNDKIDSLKFIFQDENGLSQVEVISENLPKSLESKMYYFSPIENFGKIKRISVYPVIGGKSGIESSLDYNNIIEIPQGLVGWFRLKDNYEDSAGKNTGVSYGSVSFSEIEGRKSVYLDSGYIDFGKDDSLNLKNTLAISFWINTDYKQGNILEKGSLNPNYKVSITDTGRINFSYSSSGKTESRYGLNNIADGKWHNLVITNMEIYLDGNPDGPINLNQQLDENGENLIVGGGLRGHIGDLMIYNISLDDSMAKSIFYL